MTSDKASLARIGRADRARGKVRDRRRFKVTPPPTGEVTRLVPKSATGTVFPATVQTPSKAEPVLKDGVHNCKIGGDVLVGDLKGAKILTLTLEERATCPKSCAHWRSCYGNSMGQTTRWKRGNDLQRALKRELEEHCARGPVLVRLHVLGDFYNVAYVGFWIQLLIKHPNLHVFGFTAWPEDSPIGHVLQAAKAIHEDRWMIRWSGRTGEMGSFTIDFPTERKLIGDAVVCPEQRDAMSDTPKGVHCGSCAACWQSDRPIVFVEHG